MPRFPKPYHRAQRGLWYVQIGRKQINLGPDRDEAFKQYHELMRRSGEDQPATGGESVLEILDAFLDWCQKHRAERTYDWYHDYLQSFARTIPRELAVRQLRPHHVQSWVDAQPGWKTGKRGAIIAVQRAFNWAARMGYIEGSPVRYIEKPRQGRRDVVISQEEYDWVLDRVNDEAFRDLITVCWETGCRPQEIVAVEARHVDAKEGRWVFPPEESKGKRGHRVVYLSETALRITVRLAERWPSGPLFRNVNGRPWAHGALKCRFDRLKLLHGKERAQTLGLIPPRPKRLNARQSADGAIRSAHESAMTERRRLVHELSARHGKRWCLYHFRHSFATRLLEAGVDALTVSALLGHADGAMLAKVYSHLAKNGVHLRAALKRA